MMERRQFLKLSLTSLAATSLSLEQVGWLLDKCKGTEKIGVTDFENYIVSEINKMPERQVGRITNIETIEQPDYFGSLVRGMNINRYFNSAKYWAFTFEPDKVKDLNERKKFVKGLAVQFRSTFRT